MEVDLLVLLDTSGSVFPSFNLQHQLTQNILKEINNEEIGEKLRIGLISFASEPKLVLTLKESIVVDNKEIIERLNDIKFTGSNTRIADAVELALSEFEMGGRRDSEKVKKYF
ncbi:unnamed protein product [Meloidogyne enterolobii]|uniref:Uncharacterized protein n=1 Tax=Meloidogyne enterolobii TaxID=390850 RepID=A0ACB0ZWX8_MELEN